MILPILANIFMFLIAVMLSGAATFFGYLAVDDIKTPPTSWLAVAVAGAASVMFFLASVIIFAGLFSGQMFV